MNAQYRAHFPTREYGLQRRVAAAPHRQNLYLVSGGRSSAPQRPSLLYLVLLGIVGTLLIFGVPWALYILTVGLAP